LIGIGLVSRLRGRGFAGSGGHHDCSVGRDGLVLLMMLMMNYVTYSREGVVPLYDVSM
jgi:hypothetical protein